MGAPSVLIAGRVAYAPTFFGCIENAPLSIAMNCLALFQFGPGLPSAVMIPSERRFQTLCPGRATNVANT